MLIEPISKQMARRRRMRRGDELNAGTDHHLLLANVRLKIAKVKKEKTDRVYFKVSKLRDPEIRDTFKLMLYNRFEALQQLIEEEVGLPVEDKWTQIDRARCCKEMLGRPRQINKETWEIIE